MKNKILIIRIVLTLLIALFLYYFMLPPLNLTSPIFWTYAFIIGIIYTFSGAAKLVDLKNVITSRNNK